MGDNPNGTNVTSVTTLAAKNIESVRIYGDPKDAAEYSYYHIHVMGLFSDENGKVIEDSQFSLIHEVGGTEVVPAKTNGVDVASKGFNGTGTLAKNKFFGYELNYAEHSFVDSSRPNGIDAATAYVFYNVHYVVNQFHDEQMNGNTLLGPRVRFQKQYNSGLSCAIFDLKKNPGFELDLTYTNDTGLVNAKTGQAVKLPGDGGWGPHP